MSESCKEKLKNKLVDQAERKKQLMARISTREEQIKSLTSSGIRLIKTKASEVSQLTFNCLSVCLSTILFQLPD